MSRKAQAAVSILMVVGALSVVWVSRSRDESPQEAAEAVMEGHDHAAMLAGTGDAPATGRGGPVDAPVAPEAAPPADGRASGSVLAAAPQELFLDPSHTYRLDFKKYEPANTAPPGFHIRRLESLQDAEEINRIYAARRMVTVAPNFFWENRDSEAITYFVAVEDKTNTIVGTVTGVDHNAAFGDPEKGFYSLMHFLAEERLISACQAIAHAQVAFDLTLDYILERKAFGQTVASFQNTRFTLADAQLSPGVILWVPDPPTYRIEELEPEMVVPGHGELSTVEEIRLMGEYIQVVSARVKEFVRAGKNAELLHEIVLPEPFASWEPQDLLMRTLNGLYEFYS